MYLTLHTSVRDTTIKRYRTNFVHAAEFFQTAENFTPETAEEYLSKLKTDKSTSTYINYLITLRHIADFLVYKGKLEKNFVRDSFKAPKRDASLRVQPFTVDEIMAILHAPIVYKRNQFMVIEGLKEVYDLLHEVLATTGARLSEVLRLEVKDLDFGLRTITFYKTKTVFRVVPMPDHLIERLHDRTRMLESNQLVFTNSNGRIFAKNKVLKDLKRRAGLVGINKRVYLHLYRHSFATMMIDNGSSLSHVKEILGHTSIETTEKYTHLLTKQLAQSMRRHHPIIRQGLSIEEKLESFVELLNQSDVFFDDRFKVELKRTNKSLHLAVRC